MESRAPHPGGVWEVVGVLAAVIPCGILAGLYLATSDPMFLAACAVFAVVAAAIDFFRRPGRLTALRGRRRSMRSVTGSSSAHGASRGLRAAGAVLRHTFTQRVLKLLGLALWLIAWCTLAMLYARVMENANVVALVMLVLFGGLSPILIYFGLEAGVSRLSKRISDDE